MAMNPNYSKVTHGVLQNLSTGELHIFLLNPTELQTSVSVNYNKNNTLGASRQRLNYSYTGNITFPLNLIYSRNLLIEFTRSPGDKMSAAAFKHANDSFEEYRRFLLSLCYPVGSQNDPLRRAPPPVLVLWPAHVAIKVVVTGLELRDTRFDRKQNPIETHATLQCEEFRTYRMTSSRIRSIGLKQLKRLKPSAK